ncbi:hypothetical protein, conserved [Leishmania tarentolae]|uniref:CCHC-type domain-containing protein n=1 Tax=Leishmania tarentolae TaxID=5689 RepID=A0A640K792_LEITA|nr:hypothetical protein, conserved [Leishmania tarentolae]
MAKGKFRHAPPPPRQQHEGADITAEAAPAPSFLVYPVPSIADQTFLQLIFCNAVRRSLFFGFGRGRFAVAELTSAAAAAEVEAIIRKAAAVEAAVATPEDGVVASQDRHGLAADVAAPHSTVDRLDDDDDVFEKMTLADLFAPPPGSPSQGSAPVLRQGRETGSSGGDGAAASDESPDFSHIPSLVWRGRPVHVVVSGVRVDDFYVSGGAVPEHHRKRTINAEEKRASAKLKKPCTGKRARDDADSTAALSSSPSPAANQRAAAEEHAQGSEAVDAAATAVTAASKSRFPKNCCQKCGSAAHFTRHCDGSGTTTTTTTTTSTSTSSASIAAAVTAPTSKPVKVTPLVQRTSKDQCKYCGSEAHLSRHCPSKS